jgi:uncharacterized protein HemY
MIRLIAFLVLIAALALGLVWLADRPGDIALTWQGYHIETSVFVGLAVVIGVAVALAVLWRIVRIALGLPGWLSFAARARRRNKGYAALSRGMIAAGAGDTRAARKAAAEAAKHLPNEPLSLLLKAQAAQLAGDRAVAETVFSEMAQRPETRLLGLRGLHMEAARRGDVDSAQGFALQAHRIAALPWAGAAVLDRNAARSDWEAALRTLDANVAGKITDKAQGERLRAVLETALAQEREASSPDEALRLARQAAKRAPGLVPAVTMAARLMGRKGDTRKAAKLIETAWRIEPHPGSGAGVPRSAAGRFQFRPAGAGALPRKAVARPPRRGAGRGAGGAGGARFRRRAGGARDGHRRGGTAYGARLPVDGGNRGGRERRDGPRARMAGAGLTRAARRGVDRRRRHFRSNGCRPRRSPTSSTLSSGARRTSASPARWRTGRRSRPEPPPVALPPVIDESGAEETPVVISAPPPKPEEKGAGDWRGRVVPPSAPPAPVVPAPAAPVVAPSALAKPLAAGPKPVVFALAQGAGRSGAACGGQTGVRERADAGARIALTVRRARLRPPPGSPRCCRHRPAGRP